MVGETMDTDQDDYEDVHENVFEIPNKEPEPEALLKWRQATLVLNATRRFRYTAKLNIDDKVPVKRTPAERFRTSGHALVALNRFKKAGQQRQKRYVMKEDFGDGFGFSKEQLVTINEDANVEALDDIGGVPAVCRALRVDPEIGIPGDEEDMEKRKEEFGTNTYPAKPQKSFFVFVWEAAQDTTLIILMFCAFLSLTFGLIAEGTQEGWYDGVAIGIAVILVIFVTAFSDYRQSLQFRGLDAEKANIQLKVLRGGRVQTVSIFTLVVGDVVPLAIGDQVPGDGLLVSGHSLTIDEASMTGESDPMHKDSKRPYLLSGCKVLDGYGNMVVTAVGGCTEWGRVMATINDDDDSETPLQVRLNGLATSIGKLGLVVAVMVFLVLIIRYAVTYVPGKSPVEVFKDIVDDFSIAVTIIVVAVPEGLPLAVTLTLAYSMHKMMNDKALVRHLAACETMGSATTICSDKTGTLTLNQMTATRAWHSGSLQESVDRETVPTPVIKVLSEAIALNSTGNVFNPPEGGPPEVSGSPTEAAIITWALSLGMDYNGLRKENEIIAVEAFNSAKKRAGVAIKRPGGDVVVHWKGAAEIILSGCTTWLDADGNPSPLTDAKRTEVLDAISTMAAGSLRCIAMATAPLPLSDVPAESEGWKFPDGCLTLISIVGIKDPCRPGVPDAVARCQSAGVKVRMVTGDNVHTARAIAAECGIITPDGVVIEGKDFRVMSKEQMIQVIPTIDVMARSSPTDKHLLVKMLRQMGEVVAVTGDGTNDAPALHEADIGLSMGLSGTEVAKESSDIVILDDNFTSIVKVVRWGRSVFANIQKFIQFQLTVNIAALVINFISACTDGHVPLNAVQLLWVNLIMDTLGALALATEPPTDELLEQKPVGRKAPLITNIMWRNIFIQSVYQVVVLMTLNYEGNKLLNIENDPDATIVRNTMIFNSFVFCQLFNEVNARKPDKLNIFEGLHKNPLFILVLVVSLGFQIIIVEFLHNFAKTTSLTVTQWFICVGIGFVSWPLALIGKFIPVAKTPMLDFMQHIKPPRWMRLRRKKSRASTSASTSRQGSMARSGSAAGASGAPAAAVEEDGGRWWGQEGRGWALLVFGHCWGGGCVCCRGFG
ncbi:unnamed protein product [Closterium sp. Naga37s-1]|nr:unnamed protein product [Closterium sp. Naga37s-1]